jgi:hypothetical protein
VGGASAYSTAAWVPAEPPPTPDPSPPLRGGRGEERTGVLERESSSKNNHAIALPFAGRTVRYFQTALQTRLRDLAAQFARALPLISLPSHSEGAGNAGRPIRPIAACAMAESKKAHALVRSHRNHPAFPTQWFYGLYVLSPATGLFCHRRPRKLLPANLTPASGRQDHTTSPSASSNRPSSGRPRPPHPAPRFVTLRNAPLRSGTGTDID